MQAILGPPPLSQKHVQAKLGLTAMWQNGAGKSGSHCDVAKHVQAKLERIVRQNGLYRPRMTKPQMAKDVYVIAREAEKMYKDSLVLVPPDMAKLVDNLFEERLKTLREAAANFKGEKAKSVLKV